MAKDVREGPIKPVERVSSTAAARSPLTIKYVDRPEMAETFADSVNSVSFDGQTLRVEFGVTRFDQAAGQKPTSGRRYPAARIVLTRSAALEMIGRLQQMANAIAQAGQQKPVATASGTLSGTPRRTP
jgi:predicted transcriptional regulator